MDTRDIVTKKAAKDDKKISKHVQELSEGLIGNDGLISRVTKFEDLVEACISAVKHGKVREERPAILNLLAHEFEAERFVDETEFSDITDMVLDAVQNGVRGVVILDGRKPHSILHEIFSDTGSGTLIRK